MEISDIILTILLIGIPVAIILTIFTIVIRTPRYQIVEFERGDGTLDYSVEVSRFPGFWITVKRDDRYLDGLTLEKARGYVRMFRNRAKKDKIVRIKVLKDE